jgi:hypothetical protein
VVLSKYYNESDHDDEEDAKQAKDFRGIEGWDRVDHLASALLKPERLRLTKTKTGNIVELYESLKPKIQKRIVYSPNDKVSSRKF